MCVFSGRNAAPYQLPCCFLEFMSILQNASRKHWDAYQIWYFLFIAKVFTRWWPIFFVIFLQIKQFVEIENTLAVVESEKITHLSNEKWRSSKLKSLFPVISRPWKAESSLLLNVFYSISTDEFTGCFKVRSSVNTQILNLFLLDHPWKFTFIEVGHG